MCCPVTTHLMNFVAVTMEMLFVYIVSKAMHVQFILMRKAAEFFYTAHGQFMMLFWCLVVYDFILYQGTPY